MKGSWIGVILALVLAAVLTGCAGWNGMPGDTAQQNAAGESGINAAGSAVEDRTGERALPEQRGQEEDILQDARYRAGADGAVEGRGENAVRDLTREARDMVRSAGDTVKKAGEDLGDAASGSWWNAKKSAETEDGE